MARWAAISSTGSCRADNEDACGVSADGTVFVVADGCGGMSSGRRASDLAVQCLTGAPTDGFVSEPLVEGILEANRAVFLDGERNPSRRGMGTTVVALRLGPGRAVIAHVGDCRVGLLGKPFLQESGAENLPELRWLTLDHRLWIEALLAGRPLVEVEELRGVHETVIMRAVGLTESIPVDAKYVPVEPGMLLLLCTDGLSGQVEHPVISAILRRPDGLAERCCALIEAAEAAGGHDNTTVMLVEVRRTEQDR